MRGAERETTTSRMRKTPPSIAGLARIMLRRNFAHRSSDSDIIGYSSASEADSGIFLSSDIHLLSRLGGIFRELRHSVS